MIASLSKQASQTLAKHLPDGPQTVISRAHLLWGTARAYAVGLNEAGFETAVIEDPGCPGEPMIFGDNAAQIASLMPHIPDWFCLNVSQDLVANLSPLISQQMNCPVRHLEDIYHTLTTPPPADLLTHPAVRLLTLDDLPLLQSAPPEISGSAPEHLLRDKSAAGAIINNRLVAIAQNYALTEGYGDIGVFTLPEWRGQGLAASAAAQVAQLLLANGRIPVWSCGEHNQASLRVAEKLGFVENGRRVYLIPEPAPHHAK